MKIRRLHEGFGAEVLDLDVSGDVGADDVEGLRSAFDEHQLLLLRCGGRLPPQRQVEIMSWFGPPGPVDDAGNGEGWSEIRNDSYPGTMRLPFHSDLTYTTSPVKAISLHPVEMPPGGSATAYVSGVHGWATLTRDRQEQIGATTARHVHLSVLSDERLELFADHPVRLTHPRTGRPVLFVTEYHAGAILGLDREAGHRLLQELFAHLYAPERTYLHRWRSGDLMIWDNLAVQHSRPDVADAASGPRLLQRVALNEVTYAELVRRAREQLADDPGEIERGGPGANRIVR